MPPSSHDLLQISTPLACHAAPARPQAQKMTRWFPGLFPWEQQADVSSNTPQNNTNNFPKSQVCVHDVDY